MLTIKALRAEILLLTTAMIWGFAFVAQRVGMEHVGPFTYLGVRFLLGALLLGLYLLIGRRHALPVHPRGWRSALIGGLLAGVALFAAAGFLQVGITYSAAGKAGFITGLYVIIVPLLGMLLGHRTSWGTWIGAVLAVVGLYLLAVNDDLTLAEGDGLVLIGAFFWAAHVMVIGWLSGRYVDPVLLACLQFIVCGMLGLMVAVVNEPITLEGLRGAATPIMYDGMLSVGVAFTLQAIAQRDAPSSHAALILSLESVFAVLGGWLLLEEVLSGRAVAGCGLMFAGILLSQLGINSAEPSPAETTVEAETVGVTGSSMILDDRV